MLAQYLQKTKLPVSLFWMSSAFLLPQAARAQEAPETLYEIAIEAPPTSDVSEVVYPEAIEDEEPASSMALNPPAEKQNSSENTAHNPAPASAPVQASAPVVAAKAEMPCATPMGKHECCAAIEPIGCCNPVLKARVTCCPTEKTDECGRTLPHQKTCCCCNCINATAPLDNMGFYIDILYFKPIQDTLKYGEKNTFTMGPIDPSFATYANPIFSSPPGESVNQLFDYKLGVRANLQIPLNYDEWEFDLTYTYFHPLMPPSIAIDAAQFLFTTLSNSYYPLANNSLNNQCGYINGVWRLKMDVGELELKRPFLVGKSLVIQPLLGIKTSLVRQHVQVKYQDYYLGIVGATGFPPVTSPQKVIGKSKVWGVGPELGAEMKFLIPRHFSFFLRGAFSCMLGRFNTTTKYTDFVTAVGGATGATIIREKLTRLFSVAQLQGSVSKWWMLGKCSSLELMVGWETQVWWRQNRMNWFSTVALPPDGSDLTLQGPFGRVNITF